MPPSDDLKVIKDRRPTKADEDEYGYVWMEPEPLTDRPFVAVCAARVGPGVPWCHTDEWVEPQPLPEKPKLRVGQVWKSGEGKEVTITENDGDVEFPFNGSDGRSYTSSGSYWASQSSKYDLVELLTNAPTDNRKWDAVYHAAAQCDPFACCLIELRDRLSTLQQKVDSGPKVCIRFATTADGLSPVEPAPQAPHGVTVEELVDCLPNSWTGDLDMVARYLLAHPRLGPLLRGEGARAEVARQQGGQDHE